jgi:hypothetical protein
MESFPSIAKIVVKNALFPDATIAPTIAQPYGRCGYSGATGDFAGGGDARRLSHTDCKQSWKCMGNRPGIALG